MAASSGYNRCVACETCGECGKRQQWSAFAGSSASCKNCTLVPCSGCKVLCRRSEYTVDALKRYSASDGEASILCPKCLGKGCTYHDPALYECTVCHAMYGRRRFDASQLKNKRGGRPNAPLRCDECRRKDERRLQELKSKVYRSSIRCRCRRPIHSEKCPMHATMFGERRWPGKDEGVTESDVAFLEASRPQWWVKRKGVGR